MAVQVKYYKPGQGTLTRWVAFGLVALLVLFGCTSLYVYVQGYSSRNVVVFAETAEDVKAAKEAGAKEAGGDELVARIASGEIKPDDFDAAIATPAMEPKLAGIKDILGDKTPSTAGGTVTSKIEETVEDLRSRWWIKSPWTVPVLGFELTWGHLTTTLIAFALAFLAYLFIPNHPKSAEFLIETEGELKKVNWPPRHEFLGSSFIVILSVIIISLYLMLVDLLLTNTVNVFILK